MADGKLPPGYVDRPRARTESSPYYDPAALPRIDRVRACYEAAMLDPAFRWVVPPPTRGAADRYAEIVLGAVIPLDVQNGGGRLTYKKAISGLQGTSDAYNWQGVFGAPKPTVYRAIQFSSKNGFDPP
jgi:hypothetical protein